MDRSATPWRVLEDPADVAPDRPESALEPRKQAPVPRSAMLTGALAIVLAVAAFGLALGSGSSGAVALEGAGSPLGNTPNGPSAGPTATGPAAAGRVLVVEIVGAVDHPGVYRLPAGARVGDLVAAAGGYGPRVDANRAGQQLNLAAPLHDGDQVRVPSRDDVAAPGPGVAGGAGGTGAKPAGPVDLNRSTASELDALPGIGPVTANKIIASRDEQPFASVTDLRTRKLVGEKTFEALKDLVAVP